MTSHGRNHGRAVLCDDLAMHHGDSLDNADDDVHEEQCTRSMYQHSKSSGLSKLGRSPSEASFPMSKPAGPHRSRPLNEIAADNLENDRHTVSTYRAERKSEIWEDDEREEMMRESGFPLPTSPSASPAACRAGFESQSDLIAEHASLFASPTLKAVNEAVDYFLTTKRPGGILSPSALSPTELTELLIQDQAVDGCASPTLSSNTHLISPACNEEFKNLRHTDFEFTQGNPLAQAQAQLKRKVTLIRRPACALSPLLVSSSSPSSPELRPPQLISRPGELEQLHRSPRLRISRRSSTREGPTPIRLAQTTPLTVEERRVVAQAPRVVMPMTSINSLSEKSSAQVEASSGRPTNLTLRKAERSGHPKAYEAGHSMMAFSVGIDSDDILLGCKAVSAEGVSRTVRKHHQERLPQGYSHLLMVLTKHDLHVTSELASRRIIPHQCVVLVTIGWSFTNEMLARLATDWSAYPDLSSGYAANTIAANHSESPLREAVVTSTSSIFPKISLQQPCTSAATNQGEEFTSTSSYTSFKTPKAHRSAPRQQDDSIGIPRGERTTVSNDDFRLISLGLRPRQGNRIQDARAKVQQMEMARDPPVTKLGSSSVMVGSPSRHFSRSTQKSAQCRTHTEQKSHQESRAPRGWSAKQRTTKKSKGRAYWMNCAPNGETTHLIPGAREATKTRKTTNTEQRIGKKRKLMETGAFPDFHAHQGMSHDSSPMDILLNATFESNDKLQAARNAVVQAIEESRWTQTLAGVEGGMPASLVMALIEQAEKYAKNNSLAQKPIPCKGTKSRFVGVYPARHGRWQAQVKHRSYGGFETSWDAGVKVAKVKLLFHMISSV